MGLFNFRKKKAAKTHIKSLLAVAAADGNAEPKELLLIAAVAAREGIKQTEFEELLRGNSDFKFTQPETEEKKIQYLRDMVSIMMVDGDINKNEMAICKLVALEFGFVPSVIEALILSIIAELKDKL